TSEPAVVEPNHHPSRAASASRTRSRSSSAQPSAVSAAELTAPRRSEEEQPATPRRVDPTQRSRNVVSRRAVAPTEAQQPTPSVPPAVEPEPGAAPHPRARARS
uniref:Uncharacterized protein n=1 Tax=Cucumis melo TaxID=3656 RepID=A0A9I9E3A9_CUCME